MPTDQPFSVVLPSDLAQMIKAKVASGEYASESEVISHGLRALQARDEAIESWLRLEAVPAYEALKADPARARSVSDVRASLAAEHRRTMIPR